MPGLYTITNRSDGEGISAAKYLADHQQHVDNLEPPKVDDYSGSIPQMQAMTDPGEVGSENQPTTLAGEIERLRYAIAEIKGTAQWYQSAAANLSTTFPTGGSIPYIGATAPAGWVLSSGGTIGDASSGATERAHADTVNLFTLIWNSVANAQLAIQDSAGAVSTRGASAAVDFAAHKRLPLPDMRGRTYVGAGAGGGLTPRTLGVVLGEENHALTTAELASHYHDMANHTHVSTTSFLNNAGGPYAVVGGTASDMGGVTTGGPSNNFTSSVGSGTAHNTMQPSAVWTVILKL